MTHMKRCFKCARVLPSSEFYRHPRMSDGHLGKCKSCTKRDATKHRNDNLERVLEYDRKRHKSREYHDAIEAHVAMFPRQSWAMRKVHSQLKRKALARMPCEVCGDTKVDAHHDDYLKPLEVRWLCRKHHRMWHVENGPGANLAGEVPETPRQYRRKRADQKAA